MRNNESTSWRIKKSLIFLLAFVPLLQWVPCFVMNGNIRSKKWLMEGFAYFFMIVAVIVAITFSNSYEDTHLMSYPDGKPVISDYLGDHYYQIEDYDKTPEYAQYEADYEIYESSDEYKEVYENNYHVRNVRRQVESIVYRTFSLAMLLYAVLIFFVERYRYLDALSEKENRSAVYRSLSAGGPVQSRPADQRTNRPADRPEDRGGQTRHMSLQDTQRSEPPGHERPDNESIMHENARLNVNRASEAEIAELPGISVLDAKKAVEYRNAKGGFRTRDEFFDSFSARPHVIVRLQDSITVEIQDMRESDQGQGPSSSVRKRFDI